MMELLTMRFSGSHQHTQDSISYLEHKNRNSESTSKPLHILVSWMDTSLFASDWCIYQEVEVERVQTTECIPMETTIRERQKASYSSIASEQISSICTHTLLQKAILLVLMEKSTIQNTIILLRQRGSRVQGTQYLTSIREVS